MSVPIAQAPLRDLSTAYCNDTWANSNSESNHGIRRSLWLKNDRAGAILPASEFSGRTTTILMGTASARCPEPVIDPVRDMVAWIAGHASLVFALR